MENLTIKTRCPTKLLGWIPKMDSSVNSINKDGKKEKNMKVSAITLGCKVNQYESQAMLASLEKEGYTVTQSQEDSDVI